MKGSLDRADRIVVFRIVAVYALFSALWIYLSDEALAVLIHDTELLIRISVFKGFLFIALTSYLLTHLMVRDFRKYKKAERDLRESEERYRQLFKNAPDAIVVIQGDQTFTFVNDAALRLLGATDPEQLLGKPVLEFICPDSHHIAMENMGQLLEGRMVPVSELRVVRVDGTVIDIEAIGAPITSHGKPAMQVIARDITQRKLAEQALQKLNEELETRVIARTAELEQSRVQLKAQYDELQRTYQQLTEVSAERIQAMEELREKDRMMIQQSRMAAMGEMLCNIAHHWRQPLNILGLAIQNLGISYECGAFSKELLETQIDKAMSVVLHLSQTIEDFSSFTVPDKEKSLFRIDQLIAKTVSLVEESFRSQRIAIDISTIDEAEINGFSNEYAQVLLNILMNSRDAFFERGVSDARIIIHSWKEDGRVVVTVTDNAGGIDGAMLAKIFDLYFTTKSLGKGTGVGLAMAKTIIENNMGGRLSARNVEGGLELRIEV